MKFFSEEWFEVVEANAKALFPKPGKLTLTFCEVCTDCPDGEPTKWIYYDVKNSQIISAKLGCGDAPNADYFGSAKYADHVKICRDGLDPKRAVMDKIVSIKDNQGGTNPFKLVKLIDMYMKITEAKRVSGTEY